MASYRCRRDAPSVDYELDIVGGLAATWEQTDDGETWRFKLEEDVAFHDDTPVTADAVVASLQRAFESSALASLPIDSVSAPDTRTITIETVGPFAPLPAHLTRGRTGILSPSAVDTNGDVTKPVGTGPFQFSNWEPGTSITAIGNREYRGTVPEIDRLIYEGVRPEQHELDG